MDEMQTDSNATAGGRIRKGLKTIQL